MNFVKRIRPIADTIAHLIAIASLIMPARVALKENLAPETRADEVSSTPEAPVDAGAEGEPCKRHYFYVWVSFKDGFLSGHGTFEADATIARHDVCLMIRAILRDDNGYVAIYDQQMVGGVQERWVVNPGESNPSFYPIESVADVDALHTQINALMEKNRREVENARAARPPAPPMPLYENGYSLN